MTLIGRIAFIFILTMTGFVCAIGQAKDFTLRENELVKLYSNLLHNLAGSRDRTRSNSEKFSNQFTSFIKTNPGTLSYPFNKLMDSNYVQIKTSSDGNFRMYSWDAWTGGTMHTFNTIDQWRANGKVFTKVPGAAKEEPGSFVSRIFTIAIKAKPYYLAITNAIYSTKDARQSVTVYTIDNGKLVDTVKLFRTKTKRLNSINVDFDFFSVMDRPERPLELITYDDKQKIVYIPVVDEQGKVTEKNIVYQLKDGSFEFIAIETGKRK
jgi:hypothetical protein